MNFPQVLKVQLVDEGMNTGVPVSRNYRQK